MPAALGFHPRRSLVAIALQGKRFVFHLRADLPAPEYADECAAQLLPPLVAQQPDGVLLVAYTEPEPSSDVRGVDRLSADALVAELRRKLSQHDIDVREAVRCDGARYWSYDCDREECCPSDGTPYDIESSSTLADAVFNGLEVLPDRSAVEQRFHGVAGARRVEMEAVTERMVTEVLAAGGLDVEDEQSWDHGRLGRHPDLLRAGAAYVTDLLSELDGERAGSLSDEDAARLTIWTLLLPVRDLAWSYIDRDNAEHHRQLWTGVAQRAVSPFEPAPLCLAAFACWLSGNGTQARCALDRVSEVEPAYSMGTLLTDMLERCVPPSAWRPFDPAMIRSQFPPEAEQQSA
ncbi:DUF4192 domain-containing protein [Solicola gregarius]|uniref:DUF4192 domain-containing protein n=1 Tax=Solicola gregarius TaxID=2908642 RepID=A0AA46YLX9_9ACTN|nr:DUF4192 domain-containing protein [Solicola gregarius]